ncbi:MAG: hypothetical protein Q7J40_04220 [Atribacterota bacterium]|nr:hypothetical protein [Atribacterota bacterium]
MTKKVVFVLGGLCLAVLAGCGTYGYQQDRSSRENWTVHEPRVVVMIPSSRVYFVPNLSFDLFFYNGYWWSPRGNKWYRARAYNGPWGIIERRYVPAPVYRVPKDYRARYEKQQHIPYGQWKKQGKDDKDDKKEGKQGRGHND